MLLQFQLLLGLHEQLLLNGGLVLSGNHLGHLVSILHLLLGLLLLGLVLPGSEVALSGVRHSLLHRHRLEVRVLLVEERLSGSELFLTHEVRNVLLRSSDWLVRHIHVWVLLHLELGVRTSRLQHAFLVLLHVVLLLLLV